jgi:DNA-binding transcriptional regulator YiaG
MTNVASVLKAEISRIARKEARAEVESLRKASMQHRSAIAGLRRELASLQRQLKQAQRGRAPDAEEPSPDRKYRFSAARLAAHRAKLGLSAADYGRLVGMSGAMIYLWERGQTKPRADLVQQLGVLKGMGRRQIMERLQELKGEKAEESN